MRTKIGKRIGPVPIAVVAALALAALLSAGLLVFNSGGTQAQTATGALPDVTLDVNQALTDDPLDDTATDPSTDDQILTLSTALDTTTDPDTPAVSRAFPVGATAFSIESDQDDPRDAAQLTGAEDKNGAIETQSSGNNRSTDAEAISISAAGVITIPTQIVTQTIAEQSDNTARITVRAEMPAGTALTPVRFNLTIVQDPLKVAGVSVTDHNTSGACEVVSHNPDGTVVLRSRSTTAIAAPAIKISGGACTVAGDSATVTFKRTGAADITLGANPSATVATHLVYVTGGSELTKVKPRIGKSGLDAHTIELKEYKAIAYQPQTITVAKSMADDDGMVYLIGYGHEVDNTNKLTAASTTFENDADFAVVVQFVDGPARAFDADRNDKMFLPAAGSDDDVNGSTLTATGSAGRIGMGDEDKDGYDDGTYKISGNDAEAISVVATIMDAKGRPVSGGEKDSYVDFSVMFTEGSDITDNAKDYESRVDVKKGANSASLAVSGWKASEKPVKVTVAATFTGPTAPDGLDLGTVTLIRVADAASTAKFATYSCVVKAGASADKGCAVGREASADMRFGLGEHFVVYGQFEDSLGSKVARTPVVKGADDAAKGALDTTVSSATGYSPTPSMGSVLVMVKKEATFGDYNIKVSNGKTGDAEVSQTLTITVAGPTASYAIAGPDTIELNGSGKYTVTAADTSGGVPDFGKAGSDKVEVAVPNVPAGNVYILNNGMLTLDKKTGMGSFTVYAPSGTAAGTTISIIVGTGDMQQVKTVTIGMAPTPPATDLTNPGNVKAAAVTFLGASDIQVSWTPGANAEGHYVALLSEDLSYLVTDLVPLGSDASSHKFTDVDSGTYKVAVISWRIGDDGIELGYEFDDFKTVTMP